jgi:hypothetical protein
MDNDHDGLELWGKAVGEHAKEGGAAAALGILQDIGVRAVMTSSSTAPSIPPGTSFDPLLTPPPPPPALPGCCALQVKPAKILFNIGQLQSELGQHSEAVGSIALPSLSRSLFRWPGGVGGRGTGCASHRLHWLAPD